MEAYARERVALPGLALAATGLCALGMSVGFVVLAGLAVVPSVMAVAAGDPGSAEALAGVLAQSVSQALLSVVSIPGSAIVFLAGRRMRQLRSPGLVYFGCLLACLPFCSNLCCCGGWLVAVWAVLTMRDTKVRAAFRGEPTVP